MHPESWRLRTRLSAALASGLLLNLAFPPVEQHWFAFVALVPVCLALRGVRGRRGALIGLVAGGAFFGVLLYWISYFGYAGWFVLAGAMAGSWALFGAFAARARMRFVAWPLLFAGAELFRARWPLGGFAWGQLGYTQAGGGAVAHLARAGGVVLVGAAVLLVNMAIAEMLIASNAMRARTIAAAGAIALVLVPGALPLGLAGARAGTIDIAAVQGNVPRDRFTRAGRRGRVGPEDFVVVQNHIAVTETLIGQPKPDLIVWPENSLDRDPRGNAAFFDPVRAVIAKVGSPLLAGAILDDGARFRNSNLLIDPSGRIVERYDKTHLVPFGEYVPWHFVRSLIPALNIELPVDGIAGHRYVVFDIAGKKVGTVICFESTYASLVRDVVRAGSQIVIVTTNNASFGTSPAAREHLAMSRMRAIEEGRVVVHAAVSGISAIIQPDGAITKRADLFTPALLRETLPLTDGQTPYARYGAALEVALAAGAVVAAAIPLVRRRRV